MKTIYKYKLETTDIQTLMLPLAAKIIHLDNQGMALVLWAIVDTDVHQLEERKFWVVGTGDPIPEQIAMRNPIGSVIIHPFVWHVFEER